MYNNSNGSAEHEDANPSQKETDPQAELADGNNVPNEADHQTESECKAESAGEGGGEEEEYETIEPIEDTAAALEPSTPTESVPPPQEEKDEEEKEDAIIEPAEKGDDDDAPADDDVPADDDASEDKPQQEELVDESRLEEEELVEELKEEVETKEEPSSEPVKEKATVNLELCRVCMGTEELSDIFQLEGPMRVSDIIMKVCTNIRITARDHLPHKICESCLGQVRIVNEFKVRCEASDKELRQKLKRSAKSRRGRDVIVVNCPISESENDDEAVDDDEYQMSQSEVESEPATSDDSFSPPNKRKRTPAKRGRKPGQQYRTPGRRGRPGRKPKHMAIETPPPATPKRKPGRPAKNAKSTSLSNIVYIEAPEDSTSSDDEGDQKKRRRKRGDNPCPKCDEVLPSQLALKQHLKTHPDDVFNCDRCPMWFKTLHALTNHLERHKKADRLHDEKRKERERRQDRRVQEPVRSSDAEERKPLSQSASMSSEKKRKLEPVPASSGRDLFKCVAPLTSTYWSDSFSE